MEQKTDKTVVLLVDDDPTIRMLVSNMLRNEGFVPKAVVNGKEAVETAGDILPDIILMDINMPVMDGFEACELLKSRAATKNIPVIFMTALGNDTDRIKGFEVGGEDYIIKPVNYKELLARTKRFLRKGDSGTSSKILPESLGDCLRLAEDIEKFDMPDDVGKMVHQLTSDLKAAMGVALEKADGVRR